MTFTEGITYNVKGLWLGIRTPKLLLLGAVRFISVIIFTIMSATLILAHHQDILNFMWARPESQWVVWIWHILSWLLSLLLVGIAVVLSYLVSQVLFSVIIMDYMSRITERIVLGREEKGRAMPLLQTFFYLIRQELPRTIIPVLISLVLMLVGWLTPLGPIVAAVSSAIAVVFLSWDNTDLTPARRLVPFRERFRFLSKSILFHLGFGIPFLFPGLNILFLSFAPVGATLYYIEKYG